ncbi:hypothetical protein J7I98_07585 [Streptomyces sp. ISL-98]|uniref:hypothetical protein n=1 Tax=Streptomyces sp. ISL-98 TaxID=2819192 RepID=UPI001BEC4308|nr:hypothetical protein [Streptomyces sp. ISL-98]MBT2505765.1 hypothetical protein [Streptomyces sp. ISL-98]
MWQGQQPPGGEQNPQDPNQNPYQQPGYQQPGQPSGYQQPGYQQPGYQQPNPYQQPTVPQYAVPMPPGAPRPPDGNRNKTTIIAIVAATAVVAAAVITGVVVMGKDDEGGSTEADKKAKSSPSATATSEKPSAPTSPAENPRGGSTEEAKPTIPGWKVVTNPKHGSRFDVPPEWEVQKPGLTISYENSKKPSELLIGMSSPAYFKSKWCTAVVDGRKDEYRLGAAGTRGANGASNGGTEAENVAGNWVYAAYDQNETGKFKISKAVPFTSTSGLKGNVSTATVTGVTKKNKCDSDGKAIAFAFKNADGDFAVWSLHTAKGVKGELPETTIRQILGTVRLSD